MRAGAFERAWAISDAVLAGRDRATRDDPSLPYHERWVWDGRALAGRDVLVRCYHGLGDTLQFCRYLAPLRARAARVTLEVQPELAGLLAGMADRVQGFDPAHPLPPAEADVEIMELSHALRLRPGLAPYLTAAPAEAGRGRVGVCWAAGGWDAARSIPAALLGGLWALGGPRALEGPRALGPISLQRGPAAAEAGCLGAVDPLGGAMEMGAMAGLVAGLDRVVTVDTMVAHLAGALGRPTTVLLKHEADWRWGGGDRCAWYGSVRLLRQDRPGDWGPVVARLAE